MYNRGDLVKRGQVTIFIILAILIVAGILLYFVISPSFEKSISKEIQPLYDYYISCLKENTLEGIQVLGAQGGYINLPDFEPGNSYRPTSSQLDFYGQPVPYWMYVSGNNLLKENKPTIHSMEYQLEDYLVGRLDDCNFDFFYEKGYDLEIDGGDVSVTILNNKVKVVTNNLFSGYFDSESAIVSNHEFEVKSKLGSFFKRAEEIYDYEKSDVFLESYGVDVMRMYAPVTGVEITCEPKFFNEYEIKENITQGLATNIPMIKLKGNYYELNSEMDKYFVRDIGSDISESVNFVYSPSWPSKIEMFGEDIVEPVGLQEGMGIIGFCYVPYHFIYNIDFPVLIQIYDEEELFQFGVVAVIEKSQPRDSLVSSSIGKLESRLCQNPNKEISVYTYDLDFEPVEANLRFQCLQQSCNAGTTKIVGGDSFTEVEVPACVNGFVEASAEGYVKSKQMISTNENDVVDILMKELFEIKLDLGDVSRAIVSFNGEDYSTTVVYPDQKVVKLADDYYNVSVMVYSNASVSFPSVNDRKCVQVPQQGIGGFIGLEEEKCFDINFPAQTIDTAIVGGGKTQEYFTQDMLRDAQELNMDIPLFSEPKSLDDLSVNYEKVEDSIIYLEFE